jgi:hypothetical protein
MTDKSIEYKNEVLSLPTLVNSWASRVNTLGFDLEDEGVDIYAIPGVEEDKDQMTDAFESAIENLLNWADGHPKLLELAQEYLNELK